jgi:MYXO-CTERM domain-containing protein
MWAGRATLFGVFGVMVAGAAGADPVTWVDWQSADSASVYGLALVDGATVAVTYTGERGFVQTTCGTNFWSAPDGINPYLSPTVENAPDGDPAPGLRCDIIALNLATQKSLTFSEPITNPLFAVVSLNGNGYRFDRDFDILSFGRGYWGTGTLAKQITATPAGITYDLIGTGEPHGVIQFIGTFTTVTWSSLTNEYWNGFSIAFEDLAVNVPPELEVYADGAPLAAGQAAPVVLGPIPVGTSSTATLTIANVGTGPLNLAQVGLTGPGAGDFTLSAAPPAVAAGAQVQVRLTFVAGTSPVATASVSIVSDDADEGVFTFPVRGLIFVDEDGDGVVDGEDNCPEVGNPDQANLDGDALGDLCDDDVDGDQVAAADDCDDEDATVAAWVTAYRDADGDGRGAGAAETFCAVAAPTGYAATGDDNCPAVANPDQADADDDGVGDACDEAPDAGPPDTGSAPPDAAPADTGAPDTGGVADGGARADAGVADSGLADGGDEGCACSATGARPEGADAGWCFAVLVAAALGLRRRR